MAKRIISLNETTTMDDNMYLVADSTAATNKIKYTTLKDDVVTTIQALFPIHLVKATATADRWCRIWSDGWCEQGGKKTTDRDNNIQYIPFQQQFSNDNEIFITATPCGRDLGDNDHQGIWVDGDYQITTNGFYYRNDLVKGDCVMWEAKGKIDMSKI